MLLTNEAILEHKENGRIVIEPFLPESVSINSVDVRFGYDLWECAPKGTYRDIYCPSDDDWVKVEPIKAHEIRNSMPTWGVGVIPDHADCFLLKPNGFYIATTLEKIGAKHIKNADVQIIPRMAAKSTTGRQGLSACVDAGLGETHYQGRWAMEVRVVDAGLVPIAVGTWFAQITFEESTPTDLKYDGPDRYQDGDKIRFLPKPMRWTAPEAK